MFVVVVVVVAYGGWFERKRGRGASEPAAQLQSVGRSRPFKDVGPHLNYDSHESAALRACSAASLWIFVCNAFISMSRDGEGAFIVPVKSSLFCSLTVNSSQSGWSERASAQLAPTTTTAASERASATVVSVQARINKRDPSRQDTVLLSVAQSTSSLVLVCSEAALIRAADVCY